MHTKYQKTVNVWNISHSELGSLQVGQWVSAGLPDSARSNCGRFYGVRPSGSVVVAWNGNARGHWAAYQRAVYNFAKGGTK